MTPDWAPLNAELAVWKKAGMTLPIWWRDDDAVSVTPALRRLTSLSETLGLPVHLAIIPRDVTQDLVELVPSHPNLIPVVHGWGHQNHAPADEKKSEFRLHRPMDDILHDAAAGLERLTSALGDDLRPIFVPPWNRIAPEVVTQLPTIGYRVLSTATPRKARLAAPGLLQVNTHLDPIDWRGTRGLVAPEILIGQITQMLRDRREGRADNDEPFGILTHHLVHTEDVWTFTQDLIRRLLDGPGQPWTAPRSNDIGEPE